MLRRPRHRPAWAAPNNNTTASFCAYMYSNEQEKIVRRIFELRIEDKDLDGAIGTLSQADYVDQLQLKRLKKRKLSIKGTIQKLESKLIPDVDA